MNRDGWRRPRDLVAGAVSLVILGVAPPFAGAQWHVEAAAGGVSQKSAGAAVSNTSALGGLRYEGPAWFYVSGGVPLAAEGVPWVASGAGTRITRLISGVAAGIQIDGHLHGYRAATTGETGGGLVAGALPFVSVALGPARLEGRSGISHYSSRFAGQTVSRTGHDSGLTAELRPHPSLTLAADARLFRAEEGDYPYAGAAAEIAAGATSLWAYTGRWTSSLLPDPAWGAGVVVRLPGAYSARGSYQQEPTDPLFWNETRRFWSVGLSRRVGRPPAASITAPVAPETSGGRVVFRIPITAAEEAPSVAGDFNGWTPVPMRRAGDDWVVAIAVAPGVHHYAFRAADGTWFVPDTVENRVDDGFGGTNAVLVVPATGWR